MSIEESDVCARVCVCVAHWHVDAHKSVYPADV